MTDAEVDALIDSYAPELRRRPALSVTEVRGSLFLRVGYQNSDREAAVIELTLDREQKCDIRVYPFDFKARIPPVKDATLNALIAGVLLGTASLVGLSDRLRELGLERAADVAYSTFLKQQREQK